MRRGVLIPPIEESDAEPELAARTGSYGDAKPEPREERNRVERNREERSREERNREERSRDDRPTFLRRIMD